MQQIQKVKTPVSDSPDVQMSVYRSILESSQRSELQDLDSVNPNINAYSHCSVMHNDCFPSLRLRFNSASSSVPSLSHSRKHAPTALSEKPFTRCTSRSRSRPTMAPAADCAVQMNGRSAGRGADKCTCDSGHANIDGFLHEDNHLAVVADTSIATFCDIGIVGGAEARTLVPAIQGMATATNFAMSPPDIRSLHVL